KYIYIADPDPLIKLSKLTKEQFLSEWRGITILLKPNHEYKIKIKKTSFPSLLTLLFNQKKLIFLIILLTLAVNFINIIGSYYLKRVIDSYIPKGELDFLNIMSISLIVIYLMQQFFVFGQGVLITVLSQILSKNIMLSYIAHLFKLPLSFFATRRTGDIVSRFSDANIIIEVLSSLILSVILDVSIVTGVSIVLFLQSSYLFFIIIIAFPIYALVIFLFMKPFRRSKTSVMEAGASLSSVLIEDINGIETIKSLTSEVDRYKIIKEEFSNYFKKITFYSRMELFQDVLKNFTQLLFNVLILWQGAILVIEGKISLGSLITFNTLELYFLNSLENIINLQPKFQSASVAYNRLEEIYSVQSEFQDKFFITNFKLNSSKIVISNLTYKYGYNQPLLKNINLVIEEGCKIAFVGLSGSGKTTLAKMLVNFMPPTYGSIEFGGININDIDKKTLRQLINYIPQKPYIFNGTILDNLLLGVEDEISFEEINKATEIAEIKSVIENLPLGYETELSTEHSILSGGQLQRVAIARALLTNPSVLILDESTSNLDNLTERKIIDNLMSLDITVIFIAHRLNITEQVERIFVIENGMIIENGNHEDLILKQGFYSKILKG
ncbi:TPA: peptide cleavage/export ABC transporter, partial [Streptococcus suis]